MFAPPPARPPLPLAHDGFSAQSAHRNDGQDLSGQPRGHPQVHTLGKPPFPPTPSKTQWRDQHRAPPRHDPCAPATPACSGGSALRLQRGLSPPPGAPPDFHRTGAVAITLPAIPLTLALHALAFASTSCRRRSGLAIVAVSQGVALVRERGPSDVCLVDCENGWRQRAWPQTCVHAVAGRTWFFPFARQVSIYLSLCSSSLSLSLSMFLSFSSASYFVSYLCQAESALPCSFPSFSSFAL